MVQQPFSQWLCARSWTLAVRYCKAVAWLLPPAALALDAGPLRAALSDPGAVPGLVALLGWQAVAELVCVGMVLADRMRPQLRGREWPLYLFCGIFMAMTTWVGVADGMLRGDLSLYATGATFIAAVVCTPRRVRRPMYLAGFAVLGWAAWDRVDGDAVATVAALVNPFCITVLCLSLDRFMYSRNAALYTEEQRALAEGRRADQVLYGVLPPHVADEIKRHGRVAPVKHDNMGVLFADLVGFTPFARRLPPDAVLLVLDQVFSLFDTLAGLHGAEKIKTIGDAYMAVSTGGAQPLCALALDMQDALRRYNTANGTGLRLRVGIHVGATVSGVLGTRRFMYDVWGDAVNIASRLESLAIPGTALVSDAVQRQLGGRFDFRDKRCVAPPGCESFMAWRLAQVPAAASGAPSTTGKLVHMRPRPAPVP